MDAFQVLLSKVSKWFQSGFKHLFGGLVNSLDLGHDQDTKTSVKSWNFKFSKFFWRLFLIFSSPFLFNSFSLLSPFLSFAFLSSPLLSFPFLSFPSPFFFLSFPLPFPFPSFLLSFPFLSSPSRSFPFLSLPFLSFPLRYNLPMSHIEKEVFALRINAF